MGNPPPLGREMNPIQEQEPDLMGNVLTVAVRVGRLTGKQVGTFSSGDQRRSDSDAVSGLIQSGGCSDAQGERGKAGGGETEGAAA